MLRKLMVERNTFLRKYKIKGGWTLSAKRLLPSERSIAERAFKGERGDLENRKLNKLKEIALTGTMEALNVRFRGCLVGALLGDCLGAPFEGEKCPPRSLLNSFFKKLADPSIRVPYKPYTDDTAMCRCVAQSLVDKKKFDENDMAKKFVKEFYAEPNRGYGGNVIDVFGALRASGFINVYSPAMQQFGGQGSYGNGGAMRVAPVALFCYHSTLDQIVNLSRDTARITHSNRLGYNGAILQCLAIHQALHTPVGEIEHIKFINDLITKMKEVEMPKDDDFLKKNEEPYVYVERLKRILAFMELGSSVTAADVENKLGNYVSAHESVPTAIYAFIRAMNDIEGVETNNGFQRTIHYAISLGGDTDTIASMAGSIAGAYFGIGEIPDVLQKHCEGLVDAKQHADELFKLINWPSKT